MVARTRTPHQRAKVVGLMVSSVVVLTAIVVLARRPQSVPYGTDNAASTAPSSIATSPLDPPRPDLFAGAPHDEALATAAVNTMAPRPAVAASLTDTMRGQWWLRRGAHLHQQGKADRAVEALARAKSYLPKTPEPCLIGAYAAFDAQLPERLLEFAECIQQRAPSHQLPLLYRGIAMQMLGRSDEAADAYRAFGSRVPIHRLSREARFIAERLHPIRAGAHHAIVFNSKKENP